MQNSLEVYRSIAEQAADAIFVTDNESRITYQNPEAAHMFGFSNEEIYGASILDKLHHHYPDGTAVSYEQCQVYRSAQYGETTRDFIWLVYRKNGSQFYASCTSSPLLIEGKLVGAIFFANDVTARKNAEEALLKTKEKLELAIEAAELGIFDYYPQTGELIWSSTMREHFGLPSDSPVTPETFFSGVHPEDRERVKQAFKASRPSDDGHYQYEYRTIGMTDGKERWLAARGKTYYDADGNAIRRIGFTLDITERKLTEKRLRDAAQHDTLTGLPNRALLFEYCEHLFAQADRAGANSAVIFIDLDRFKPISDIFGHEVGDKVLQEVARRLLRCTRKEDIVCRLGGDEFLIVLPRIHSSDDPETVAEHVLEEIGKPLLIDSLELSVSPSIGISLYKKHGSDLAALIRLADLAMYAAKNAGRNTYRTYIPEYQQLASDRLHLEQHLKLALESNRLTLLYQPVVDVSTGNVIGAEALIRLPGEDGTLLRPDQFIPIAEAAGLIDKLGEWVAREACRQHQFWRHAGLPAMSMAINVSPSQFRHRNFASQLAKALEETGMDPNCLQVEVTESMVMDNIPDAIIKLNELKAMGVRIALDDFGTGYSSLSHLSNLPLDKLKIDQSFINELHFNESSQSVTDTIIGMGKSLNLQVVGEGIESEEAMSYLRHHGCDQAQGYLFSEPLSALEFESWYRSRQLQQYH